MQLTLTPPIGRCALANARPPSHGLTAPSRDAARAQLDRLAAVSPRPMVQGLGSAGGLVALLGGCLVVAAASMWQGGNETRQVAKAAEAAGRSSAAQPAVAAPTPALAVAAAPVPSITAPRAEPPISTVPETSGALLASVALAPPLTDPSAVAEEAARKARARQAAAEAKRKAAQMAQERAAAEDSERLQREQQAREAEQQRMQLAAEQDRRRAAAAAAEQARVLLAAAAPEPRRTVRGNCAAAGGYISEQFCRSRECAKSEFQSDPVCVGLRESEALRLRASLER